MGRGVWRFGGCSEVAERSHEQGPALSAVMGLCRRILCEGRSGGLSGAGGCLPPPRHDVPSWLRLPLKTQAVISSGCSVGQTGGRSQMERRDGKTGGGN